MEDINPQRVSAKEGYGAMPTAIQLGKKASAL
jgi:hypothetical protein